MCDRVDDLYFLLKKIHGYVVCSTEYMCTTSLARPPGNRPTQVWLVQALLTRSDARTTKSEDQLASFSAASSREAAQLINAVASIQKPYHSNRDTSVTMSDSEDPLDQIDEGGDDLFGDEDDAGSPAPRIVDDDDDDLASDPDDTGERRRYDDDDNQVQHETKEKVVMAVQAYRHRIPKPKDNIVRKLRSVIPSR